MQSSDGGPPHFPHSAAARDQLVRKRPRSWPVITAVVAVPVLAIGLGAYGLYRYANADNIEFIDREDLLDAASVGCAGVVRTLEVSPDDVAAGNAAIGRLVAGVEAVGPDAIADDYPTADWLVDWRDLEEARAASADGSPLVVPRTEDDYPITVRMIDAAPEPCERAVQLAVG